MSACACADCEASCPGPINYPEEDEEFLINGLDGVIVIMLIVFFIIAVAILTVLVWYHYFSKSDLSKLQRMIFFPRQILIN